MFKYIKSWFLLALLSGCFCIDGVAAEAANKDQPNAEVTDNSTVQAATVNTVLIRQQQIASQIRHQDAIWLKSSQGDWLALYRQDETGKRLGNIILIPDKGLEVANPGIISFLAKSLTAKGWSTLTVSMPFKEPLQATNQETTEFSNSILTAAMDYLQQLQAGDTYLLLQGQQQNIFMNIPQSSKGVILVNLATDSKTNLPDQLMTSSIPLLDIIGTRDRRLIDADWKRRRNLAVSAQLPYRQLVFPGINRNFKGMEKSISRIISAWLKKQNPTQ